MKSFEIFLAALLWMLSSKPCASYQTWSSLPNCGKFCISNALGTSFDVGCDWLNVSCTCRKVDYLRSLDKCVNNNKILGCGGQTSTVQSDVLNYQWYIFCPQANGTSSDTMQSSPSTNAQIVASPTRSFVLSEFSATSKSSHSTSIGSPVSADSGTSTSTISSPTTNSTSSSHSGAASTSVIVVTINAPAAATSNTSPSTSTGSNAAPFAPAHNTGVNFGGDRHKFAPLGIEYTGSSTVALLLLVGATLVLL